MIVDVSWFRVIGFCRWNIVNDIFRLFFIRDRRNKVKRKLFLLYGCFLIIYVNNLF